MESTLHIPSGFPDGSVKNPPANAGDVGKSPWRRKWQPTPVLLPGESHGQRSLVGYSPRGRKESDTTKLLSTRAHTHTHTHTYHILSLELALQCCCLNLALMSLFPPPQGHCWPQKQCLRLSCP